MFVIFGQRSFAQESEDLGAPEEVRELASEKKQGAAPFTNREGTIADTNSEKLFKAKEELRPLKNH